MPLLLHRSPAAGRALAWRSSSRDIGTATGLTPLSAVRHLFRDHSTDSQHVPSDRHPSRNHPRQQPQPHRGQKHHAKVPDASADWQSLYLGAKLAHWSGLCYFPYDTIPRTLQEEGLKLVAYGRTSYTCWYVADGCLDLEALRRRAFPPRPQQPQQPSGPSGFGGQSGDAPDSNSNHAGAGFAAGAGADYRYSPRDGGLLPSSSLDGAMGPRPDTDRGSLGGGTSGSVLSMRGGDEGLGQEQHAHRNDSSGGGGGGGGGGGEGRGGHSQRDHGPGHTLRDGHIHLRHAHPALHLRQPGGGGGEATAGAAAAALPPGLGGAVTPGTRCRFIFLRGVQWSAHDTNTLSLSASLAAFWPAPLLQADAAPEAAAGGGGGSEPALEHLVAHSGVAALARELLPALLPHIRDAEAAGVEHLVFAGHSLGGSLAKLVWAMSIAQGHRSPDTTSCHTFGSPPVLTHTAGGGGARVLRLLRAPPAAIVNWVLEHDPVPRAMLTADPYFSAARRAVPGLAALLDLRGAVLGEGAALSSGRFLYESVGKVLLLRWSTKGGCEVVCVSEAESDTLLQLALDEAMTTPVRSLQYWLDHHHASYHHDLEAAALAACRQHARTPPAEGQTGAGAATGGPDPAEAAGAWEASSAAGAASRVG